MRRSHRPIKYTAPWVTLKLPPGPSQEILPPARRCWLAGFKASLFFVFMWQINVTDPLCSACITIRYDQTSVSNRRLLLWKLHFQTLSASANEIRPCEEAAVVWRHGRTFLMERQTLALFSARPINLMAVLPVKILPAFCHPPPLQPYRKMTQPSISSLSSICSFGTHHSPVGEAFGEMEVNKNVVTAL